GGPRVSEGRERGATSPELSLPCADPLRGPPSPAEGGGQGDVCLRPRRARPSTSIPSSSARDRTRRDGSACPASRPE
ncbi:hypothetical protein FV232_27610, partial [Methylobacterium sp. WL30]